MNKTVVCIAAHPDDEALGVGGTLAKHIDAGDNVHLIFMTNGVSARGSEDGKKERRDAAIEAAKALGIDEGCLHFNNFPDNQMDSVPLLDVAQALEKTLSAIQPRCVYTHHMGDLNVDHQITARATLTACRPMPGSTVDEIYAFEVLSSTEWMPAANASVFAPDYIVDIHTTYSKKVKALQAYDTEMRDFPHSRSYENVDALATYRGACHGYEKAEAFVTLRKLWR